MTSVDHSTAIKAIPTRYAGCHFRSRLEARWAVMLDADGVDWQYEHEGYECERRLGLDDQTFYYLPDFQVSSGSFTNRYGKQVEPFSIIEVKGAWTPKAVDDFVNAVGALGTCRNDGHGVNALIAGHPGGPERRREMGGGWAPWELHFHKGDMFMRPCPRLGQLGDCFHGMPVGADIGGKWWMTGHGLDTISIDYHDLRGLASLFTNGASRVYSAYLNDHFPGTIDRGLPVDWNYWQRLANVGKSARFEHGQSGAS